MRLFPSLFSILPVLTFASLAQADWPQFRGPNASAVSSESKTPGNDLKIAWNVNLPGRGLSAPIIVGDKLFLTAASGPEQAALHVFCFSTKDGSKLWERQMRSTGRTMTHNKTCVAAPTPCSDGQRVFALFSTNDLFAFDLDGNLLWLRGLTYDYANASNSLGMAQSPLIVDGVLVVQSENDSESFTAGIDVSTGRNLWKMDRPKAANWSSALAWKNLVVLQSSAGLTAVEPKTGKTAWNYADGASTIPSSALDDSTIYATSNGITALVPEEGAVSQRWRNEKLKPGTASPVVVGDSIYVVNSAGVLLKGDIKTGADDSKFKLRLKGPFSGSPVASGSRLYIVGERGTFQAIETASAEGSILQEIELTNKDSKDLVLGTPAISGGAVYARSDKKLWKLN